MKDDSVYLEHIREAIEKILSYSSAGREEFVKNPMAQDAVIFPSFAAPLTSF